jgi:hypothetical protein
MKKTTLFIENVSESAMACLVTMVKGNVLALSLGHLVIASKTGIIAGVVASVAVLLAKTHKRWVAAAILGLATAIVDFYVHPGAFGTLTTEAIVTGAGAAVLSYVVGTLTRRFQARETG